MCLELLIGRCMDGKTVTVCDCPQGIDWTVVHEGENVKLILEDGTEIIVSLEKNREQVLAFVDEIEAFYNSCTPKMQQGFLQTFHCEIAQIHV